MAASAKSEEEKAEDAAHRLVQMAFSTHETVRKSDKVLPVEEGKTKATPRASTASSTHCVISGISHDRPEEVVK